MIPGRATPHATTAYAARMADRTATGYSGRDDADLINMLSAVEGADIAIIFVEQSAERVKISWRLCGQAEINADVAEIAQQFGGGGHRAAAGADVDGTLESVSRKVLNASALYLERLRNEQVNSAPSLTFINRD